MADQVDLTADSDNRYDAFIRSLRPYINAEKGITDSNTSPIVDSTDMSTSESAQKLSVPPTKGFDESNNAFRERDIDYYTDPTAQPNRMKAERITWDEAKATSMHLLYFVTSPFMAIPQYGQAGAVERYKGDPRIEEAIAKTTKEHPFLGRAAESFIVGTNSFMRHLMPTWRETGEDMQKPGFGATMAERIIPEAPTIVKQTMALTLDLGTDPTISIGLPALKTVQRGLQVTRAQVRAGIIPEIDPISAGINELLLITPLQRSDELRYLAAQAGAGDKDAFEELIRIVDSNEYQEIMRDILTEERVQFEARIAKDFSLEPAQIVAKETARLTEEFKKGLVDPKLQERVDLMKAQGIPVREITKDMKALTKEVEEEIAAQKLPRKIRKQIKKAAIESTKKQGAALYNEFVLENIELSKLNNREFFSDLVESGALYKIFKLNKGVITKDNLTEAIKALAQSYYDLYNRKVRPLQTTESVKIRAQNVEFQKMMNWKMGETWNDATIFAARATILSLKDELLDLAVKMTGTADPYHTLAFTQTADILKTLYTNLLGAGREAGLALKAFQYELGDIVSMRSVKEAVQLVGQIQDMGIDRVAHIMGTKLLEAEKAGFALTYLRNGVRVWRKGEDALFEAYVNGNLWAITTSLKNILSTSTMVAIQPLERYATLPVGNWDAISEGNKLVVGMAEGTKDVFMYWKDKVVQSKIAGRVLPEKAQDAARFRLLGIESKYPTEYLDPLGFLRNGEAIAAHEYLQIMKRKNISSINFGLDPSAPWGKVVDAVGRFTRVPGTALTYQDAAFKMIGYRMGIRDKAYRQAARYAGDDWVTKGVMYKRAVDNPAPEVLAAGKRMADYVTFQTQLEGLWRISQSLAQARYTRWFFPYYRTPVNLIKTGAERTPLGYLKALDNMLRGNPREAQLAAARATMGSIAAGVIIATIDEKNIIGGYEYNSPYGRSMRQQKRLPYSIRFGNTWITYEGIDYLRATLGLVASYKRLMAQLDLQDPDDVNRAWGATSAIVGAFAQVSMDQRWLDELGSLLYFVEAARSGDVGLVSSLSAEAGRIAGASVVPASKLLAAYNKAFVDENFRIAEGFIQNFYKEIPGLSSTLPSYKDLEGNDLVWHETLGPDLIHRAYEFVMPFKLRPNPTDVVRYELYNNPIEFPPIKRIAHGVKLTPTEKVKIQEYTGKGVGGAPTLFEAFETAILSNFYQNATKQGKAAILQNVYDSYRTTATNYLIMESKQFSTSRDSLYNRIIEKREYEKSLFVPEETVR